MSEKKKEGLALLLEPFPANQIGKLPKPTEAQTKEVRADFKKGIRCAVCGGWHHPKVVHLDYVGHAALTRRLLEADMEWNWEPVAIDENGMPIVDDNGGMWIRLTVCGVTRLGYGDSGGKAGANATKERIGDALRNAAMRFGAALDLWSKEDLNKMDVEEDESSTSQVKESLLPKWELMADKQKGIEARRAWYTANEAKIKKELTSNEVALLKSYCKQLGDAENETKLNINV